MPERIGSYLVLSRLGEGGMGEVFLARHELLERMVAIKRFSARALHIDREELTERFLREGKALAALHHPGIVTVHDLFVDDARMYMVLELVDGHTLSTLLQGGPAPVDVACVIALHLLDALDHAHRLGIVHRDLKTSNVMISRRGEVKLMDFGVARNFSLETMTGTGVAVGTPMYLAPEVLTHGRGDERSDIYGVGAVLYHLLSGRRIFDRVKEDELFELIAEGKIPRLEKLGGRLPWRLRRIVHRCLAKKPTKRYPSAEEAKRALERFARSRGLPTDRAVLGAFVQSRRPSKEVADPFTSTVEAPKTDTAGRVARLLVLALALGVVTFLALRLGLVDF